MNKKGYGPAKLDKSTTNKAANRGREQQRIEYQKGRGINGNTINGVSPKNPKAAEYLEAAKKEYGPLIKDQ